MIYNFIQTWNLQFRYLKHLSIQLMNLSKHLTEFYDQALHDPTLKPNQMSLFMFLFQFWCTNKYINPINIHRTEVMNLSKIASIATYHKCIRELHDKGYIKYHPSNNPFKSSMVVIGTIEQKRS
jgi:hypothetical protein